MSTYHKPIVVTRLGRPTDGEKLKAIIETATKSFLSVGFAATSIERVAADAGVAKATIYKHFKDKRGLFAAASTFEFEKIQGKFTINSVGSDSVREQLSHVAKVILAFVSRPLLVQFERRMAVETEQDPSLGVEFLNGGPRAMRLQVSHFLEGLAAAGKLKIDNPSLASELFIGMCSGFSDMERRHGAEIDEKHEHLRLETAVDMFLSFYGEERS